MKKLLSIITIMVGTLLLAGCNNSTNEMYNKALVNTFEMTVKDVAKQAMISDMSDVKEPCDKYSNVSYSTFDEMFDYCYITKTDSYYHIEAKGKGKYEGMCVDAEANSVLDINVEKCN